MQRGSFGLDGEGSMGLLASLEANRNQMFVPREELYTLVLESLEQVRNCMTYFWVTIYIVQALGINTV